MYQNREEHKHKKGDRVEYLDNNEYPTPKWKKATIVGLDWKDGRATYDVNLDSGEEMWGYEYQVRVAR